MSRKLSVPKWIILAEHAAEWRAWSGCPAIGKVGKRVGPIDGAGIVPQTVDDFAGASL